MVLRHQARVLERQLHTRVRYRPADRAILASLGRLLPRDRWRSFLVTPDTLLRWHRNATKNKWRRWRKRRGRGRPPDATSWSNSSCGWGAITEAGGVSVSRASSESSGSAYRPRRSDGFCAELAWGPLHGVAPRGPSSFVSRLKTCWPRTASPWTRWRLKQLYVLFVIELSSREAHILGVTVHPKGAFVTQVARNLMGDLADRDRSVKFLIGPGHQVHDQLRRGVPLRRHPGDQDPGPIASGQCLRGTLGEIRADRVPGPDAHPGSGTPRTGAAGVRRPPQPTAAPSRDRPRRAHTRRRYQDSILIGQRLSSQRAGRPHPRVPPDGRVARGVSREWRESCRW